MPEEITRIGMFHRQKLNKTAITISVDENYELNDGGCYRIRRLEENLYRNYLPKDYRCDDVITYQWVEERDHNMKAHYNFYFTMEHNKVSKLSMLAYLLLVFLISVIGGGIYDLIKLMLGVL